MGKETNDLNVMSLFDGISCGQLALKEARIPFNNYYSSEIDKNAIRITQKNFPNTIQIGDVTKIDFSEYRHCNLLIGGSPCQSLSIVQSKNRKNLLGKSALFFEFVRAFETLKPQYFFFENVSSMNEESKHIISDLLHCDPILVNSNLFSAQDRPRLYWTNIPFEMPKEKCPLVLKDILDKIVDEKYFYNCGYDFLGENKAICARLHINGHDILKRVHGPNFKCHTLTAVCGGNQQKKILIDGRVRKLTPNEYEKLQTLPIDYTVGISDGARYRLIGNGWTKAVVVQFFKNIK